MSGWRCNRAQSGSGWQKSSRSLPATENATPLYADLAMPLKESNMSAIDTIDELKVPPTRRTAVLDEAHIGDIRGALGTINYGDDAPRTGWLAREKTLFAILGPGLIVMVGDNAAGAFGPC